MSLPLVNENPLRAPGPAGLVGAAIGWIAYEYGAFDDIDQVDTPVLAATATAGIALLVHLAVSN